MVRLLVGMGIQMCKYQKYILVLLLIASTAAKAAPQKADPQLCMLCHGAGGNTSSELYPTIAGQNTPYFISQMKAFRDKSRADENAQRYMWGISSRLSDADIEELANYFQKQTPLHYGAVVDQLKYDRGSVIFNHGLPESNVPSCISCHGEKAQGSDTIPRLAGQHETYIKKQLNVFKGVQRPAGVVMHMVVNGLTESDIDSIAHYLQAQ